MKRFALVLLASFALSGCASILDEAWRSSAEEQCQQETSISKRQACYDEVERTARENR